MKWFRALAPALLALAVIALFIGRGDGMRTEGPELLRVLELAPHDIEVGDRAILLGDGFPSGRSARIVFRGILHRPGQPVVHGAEILAKGNVVSPERIEIVFDDALERLFASTASGLAHTTFEGDVEVGFAASTAGAPPVSGILVGTTLDMRPSIPANNAELARDGAIVLAALGIHATAVGSGLLVDSVAAGSRAQAAGMSPGDVLARFDGVRVASTADVVPPPGERDARVQLYRGRETVTCTLSVAGLSAPMPWVRARGPILVIVSLATVLLFTAPLPAPIARRIQRIASRIRSKIGASPRSSNRTAWSRAFARILASAWPTGTLAAGADALSLGILATFSFGPTLVAARVDVALIFGVAASALTAASWAAQPTIWRGIRSAAHITWQHLPGAVALASVVVSVSSLKLQEIARAQGGMPWEWLIFRSPATLVAMAIVASTALIEPHVGDRRDITAWLDESPPQAPPLPSLTGAVVRLHRTLIAGITASLFLGGWLLPGVSPSAQDGSLGLQLVGALWLLAKTGLVLFGLACVRFAATQSTVEQRSSSVARLVLPASIATLAGSLLWTRWDLSATSQTVVSTVLAILIGLAAGAIVERVRFASIHPNGDGHISPFL